MAGYSATPLRQKLGIKAAHRIAVLGAPKGFDAALGALPETVRVTKRIGGKTRYDVIVCFAPDAVSLKRNLPRLIAAMQENAGLWVAWPKKSSGVRTDMTEGLVRELTLPMGLVDNKVCAIDETWSGLRCVIRLENRSKKHR